MSSNKKSKQKTPSQTEEEGVRVEGQHRWRNQLGTARLTQGERSMTLKAVVDSLDDIPEALHAEYQEKDGKFYLDLDGTISTHTSILPLARSLESLKRDKAARDAKITALEAKVAGLPADFDPTKYQDVLDELEALKKDPARNQENEAALARVREQYEQRIRNAEAKRVEDLAAKDREITELNGTIGRTVVDGGLTEQLTKAGVAPEFLKATRTMLKGQVKTKKNETTGDYEPIVESDLGEVPLAQFVENWAKSDEGKPFVIKPAGSGAKGSGKESNNEDNPWHKDTLNMTRQGQVLMADRVKAERLMKAAGRPQHEIAAALGG
jgi:hypothetical protein